LQQGEEVSIGLVCSEKQAIDATLASLAAEDPRFTPIADQYWNARGGSFSDGGAFLMNVRPKPARSRSRVDGGYTLEVTDKSGRPVATPAGQTHCNLAITSAASAPTPEDADEITRALSEQDAPGLFRHLRASVAEMGYARLRAFVNEVAAATAAKCPALGIEVLTLALDRQYPTGDKKRSSVLTVIRAGLETIFERQPLCGSARAASGKTAATHRRVTWDSRAQLSGPADGETTLLIDARRFSPEGADCDAILAVRAYELGWRHMVHYNSRGTRFHAAGFGPATEGLRVDCYDNVGDYLASGMDGLEAVVHGNAQDQLCQVAKRGKLVVYGDVGQTFLYGAKGGAFYVMGNAAGRPMINAVGKPRVVINGTALDFLAESFMAGDPHKGGGFAIVNGVRFDEHGKVIALPLPYPGSNLLSLASGGAIYVRDPHHTLVADQLNGGAYRGVAARDWKLILPYLEENERLFGIEIERDLLTVDGVLRKPAHVYRKVMPRKDAELEAELEGMGE